MLETVAFFVFAGIALGCACGVVLQKNPLYSAISLIGVFISLASLYVTLASPFIAAVQILVYAGAIMVLVIFVIMLLNVEEDILAKRLQSLGVFGAIMGIALGAQALFIFYAVAVALPDKYHAFTDKPTMGSPFEIGKSLFTEYLLPFEATGVLLLMAIVGAMMLSRRLQPEKLETVLEGERERRSDNWHV